MVVDINDSSRDTCFKLQGVRQNVAARTQFQDEVHMTKPEALNSSKTGQQARHSERALREYRPRSEAMGLSREHN